MWVLKHNTDGIMDVVKQRFWHNQDGSIGLGFHQNSFADKEYHFESERQPEMNFAALH